MTRESIKAGFAFAFTMVSAFVNGCEEIPEIEKDTITLSWSICEYKIGKDIFYDWTCDADRILTGVNVCVEDRPDIQCSVSGSRTDGYSQCFVLEGIPKNSEVLLSMKRDRYISRLIPIKTGERNFDACNFDVERDKLRTLLAYLFPPFFRAYKADDFEGADTEYCDLPIEDSISPESEYGQISAIALEFSFSAEEYPYEYRPKGPVRNTTVSITHDSVSNDVRNPVYTNERGIPCYNSKDSKGIENGYALFNDLEPGDYFVEFDVPDTYFCIIASIMTDRILWGFRTDKPNRTKVPVRKGYNTITALKCYSAIADAGTQSSIVRIYDASTDTGTDTRGADFNEIDAFLDAE